MATHSSTLLAVFGAIFACFISLNSPVAQAQGSYTQKKGHDITVTGNGATKGMGLVYNATTGVLGESTGPSSVAIKTKAKDMIINHADITVTGVNGYKYSDDLDEWPAPPDGFPSYDEYFFASGISAPPRNENYTLLNTGLINVNTQEVIGRVSALGIGGFTGYFFDSGDTIGPGGSTNFCPDDNNNGSNSVTGGNLSSTNSGTVNVIAKSTDDASALGLQSFFGRITVVCEMVDTEQCNGANYLISNLNNSGNILVNATSKNGDAYATGMESIIQDYFYVVDNFTGTTGSSVSNYGDYKLTNSGNIEVAAASKTGRAVAFGMEIWRGGSTTVNNTGSIQVSAFGGAGSIAHEVIGFPLITTDNRGHQTVTEPATYKVGTWATSLRDFSKFQPFAVVGNGGNVIFDNSKLILRAGSIEDGFVEGASYKVSDMVQGYDNTVDYNPITATVKGRIKEVVSETSLYQAYLEGTEASNQTVSLRANITKETNPTTGATVQTLGTTQTSMTHIGQQVQIGATLSGGRNTGDSQTTPPAGSYSSDSQFHIFFAPYGTVTDNNDLNYDAHNLGIAAGITYALSERLSLGAHLDINRGNYSSENLNQDTDSHARSFGLHAVYNFTPQWYGRAQVTHSWSENDNTYHNDIESLWANNTYDGSAIYAALNTGYVWEINRQNTLTSEVGLSYLSLKNDAYDIKWGGDPTYTGTSDVSLAEMNYDAFYLTAKVNYQGEFYPFGDATFLRPQMGLGIRQNISGNEIDSTLRLGGTDFTTQSTEDKTVLLASGGLEIGQDDFSVNLLYSGDFGSTQTTHSGALMLNWNF